ncbi:MAG: chemotaxis response regulator protein-glutamate methylesterase [Fusobacteriia bacterium 4572_132]|nr:MAG: chemotaxis response regulator protein-glutamate methylesterase [Fusobacteriia bacterium 4572_132]
MKKIKVLVIDDSALVRKILRTELPKNKEIEVVGVAPDPIVGRDKIVELKPDVIILDIEMPRMDGLTFLEKLMKHYPLPVIILSSLAKKGGEVALRAMELGAVEVISKAGTAYSINNMTEQLIEKIKSVSKIKNLKKLVLKRGNNNVSRIKGKAMLKTTEKIIAIGASTGGTNAIKDVLIQLPADMPPILIVQHMPENFTTAFAKRLNDLCALEVREAKNNDSAIAGRVLLAPGNKHMLLKRSGARYYVEIKDGPMFFHQKPSVEVLFKSVAKYAGSNAIGVIMTGMGKDGAKGLLEMKEAGAYTLAQNEKSCVVYGMPKEAVKLGAHNKEIDLLDIPQELVNKRS